MRACVHALARQGARACVRAFVRVCLRGCVVDCAGVPLRERVGKFLREMGNCSMLKFVAFVFAKK